MKFFENMTNRKVIAFFTANIVGVALVALIIFFAVDQLVSLIGPFLAYFAGIMTTFVAANAYEDGQKAKAKQPTEK